VPDPKAEAPVAGGTATAAAPAPKPGETQLLINGAPAPGQ